MTPNPQPPAQTKSVEELREALRLYGRAMSGVAPLQPEGREAFLALETAFAELATLRESVRVAKEALKRVAYEPQGPADASHEYVLEAVVEIAKDALAVIEAEGK